MRNFFVVALLSLVVLPLIAAKTVSCSGGYCPPQGLGIVVDTSGSSTEYGRRAISYTTTAITSLLSNASLSFDQYLFTSFAMNADDFIVKPTRDELGVVVSDSKYHGSIRNAPGHKTDDWHFSMDSAQAQLRYFKLMNMTGTIIFAADDETLCNLADSKFGTDAQKLARINHLKGLAASAGVSLVFQVFLTKEKGKGLWCSEAGLDKTKDMVRTLAPHFTMPADAKTFADAVVFHQQECVCNSMLSVLVDNSNSFHKYSGPIMDTVKESLEEAMETHTPDFGYFALSTFGMDADKSYVSKSFSDLDVYIDTHPEVWRNKRKEDDTDPNHKSNDFGYMIQSLYGILKVYEEKSLNGTIVVVADDEELCDIYDYPKFTLQYEPRVKYLAAKARSMNVKIVFHVFKVQPWPWCTFAGTGEALRLPNMLADQVVNPSSDILLQKSLE